MAVDRYRCRESVEVQKHQTQEMRLDRSTRCRGGVEIAIRKILKKLEETFKDQDWSEMREFGRENKEQSREISSEMRFGSHEEVYIEPQ